MVSIVVGRGAEATALQDEPDCDTRQRDDDWREEGDGEPREREDDR